RTVKKAAPPAPPLHPFVGTWGMRWGCGSACEVTFAPGGSYWCDWRGVRWVGAWELQGPVLVVREWRQADECGALAPSEWSVELDHTGKGGTLSRGGAFTLVTLP